MLWHEKTPTNLQNLCTKIDNHHQRWGWLCTIVLCEVSWLNRWANAPQYPPLQQVFRKLEPKRSTYRLKWSPLISIVYFILYCVDLYVSLCQSVTLFLFMYMQFFHLVPPLEIHNLYFGKHNKGDKSYKFMLQVANFHR
jgi:hypothetical protein